MKAFALRPLSHFKLALVPFFASLCALVSVPVVLVGCWLEVPRLTRILEHYPPTSPLSALGLFFVGLSLFLREESGSLARPWPGPAVLAGWPPCWVLSFCSFASGAIRSNSTACLRLSSSVATGLPESGTIPPFWIVARAAGPGLVLLDSSKRSWLQPTQLLSIVVANIILLRNRLCVRHRNLYLLHASIDSGLSLPAAWWAGTLALGILCARPNKGFMAVLTSAGGGGVLARRLLLLPAVLPIVFTIASTILQCRRAQ